MRNEGGGGAGVAWQSSQGSWEAQKPPLWLLLLIVQVIAPLPTYLGIVRSMALGTTFAAALIVVATWLFGAVLGRRSLHRTFDFVVQPTLGVLIVLTIVLAHTSVAIGIESLDLGRSVASLAPLVLLIGGGLTLGRVLSESRDEAVDSAARVSFWVLVAFIALRITGAEPLSDRWPKAIFPYSETSHFALAFGPIWMYQCVRAGRRRALWWLILGFGVGIMLQSLAFLACCALAALVCRRGLLVTGFALVLLMVGLPLELAYFANRLDFSGAGHNLSSLVYVQGWQQVWQSWTWSSGWGVGFQQLGFRELESGVAELIRMMAGGTDLNATDGSFVFAKLVSEFGVLGLILAILYGVIAARCLRHLRRGESRGGRALCECVVVAYGVDMFIRGTGYFVESTFLVVAALSAHGPASTGSSSARG